MPTFYRSPRLIGRKRNRFLAFSSKLALSAIAGVVAGVGSLVGVLTGAGALLGVSAGVATVVGVLTASGALAGASNATSSVSGVLTATGSLAGASNAVSTCTGTLTASGALAGASNAVCSVSGVLTGSGALAGASNPVLTVTGAMGGAGSNALNGVTNGVCSVSGVLTGSGALAGASSCTSTATGVLAGSGRLIGVSTCVSTLQGVLQGLRNGAGAATCVSSCSGVMIASGALVGATNPVCGASGVMVASGALRGVCAGVLTCSLDIGSLGLGLFETNGNIIRSRFKTQIATPLSLPTQYDNAPFTVPDSAPWCRLEVDVGALTQRTFGDANTYRKSGEFRAILRIPAQAGDGTLTEIVDSISTGFRMAVDQGVHFGVPRIASRSRVGAWWDVVVSCPFYDDVRVELPAGTPGAITGMDDVYAVIRTRFRDLVATPEALPTAHENAPFTEPDSSPWALLTILPGESDIAELGPIKTYRTPGVVMVRIFVPLESGDSEARRLADVVVTNFRSVRDRGVLFRTPRAGSGEAQGPWWTVNVEVPFLADLRAV